MPYNDADIDAAPLRLHRLHNAAIRAFRIDPVFHHNVTGKLRNRPADLLDRIQAVRGAVDPLSDSGIAMTKDSVAERFARAPRARVQEILQALETLGFMHQVKRGYIHPRGVMKSKPIEIKKF